MNIKLCAACRRDKDESGRTALFCSKCIPPRLPACPQCRAMMIAKDRS